LPGALGGRARHAEPNPLGQERNACPLPTLYRLVLGIVAILGWVGGLLVFQRKDVPVA
jgi:hypothetical protein